MINSVDIENKQDRIAVIIGASGFLGNKVYSSLKDDNVVGTYNRNPKEGLVYLNICNGEEVKKFFETYHPQFVFIISSITDTDYCEKNQKEAYKTNVTGVKNVLEFANCKIIYFSTDYVFDGSAEKYYEDAMTNPLNYYGKTKQMAEELILSKEENLVIRVTGLYGYSGENSFLNEYVNNDVLYKEVDLFSSNLYIDDILQNLDLLKSESGIIHMSDGEKISRYDFCIKAVEILGLKNKVIPIEVKHSNKVARRPKNNVLCSNHKQIKISSLDEGLVLLREEIRNEKSMSYDLHCHSIRSNDATSTILENIAIAKRRNLDIIAITDHGAGMIDGPDPSYFMIASRMPPVIEGVKVLYGCEANILDALGRIDLVDEILEVQDIVLVGLHELTEYSTRNIIDNTKAVIAAMENKNVDVISHPYRNTFPVDLDEVYDAAKSYGVLLEMNAHVLKNKEDTNLINVYKKFYEKCIADNCPFSIGSDAHFAYEVGAFEIFQEIGVIPKYNLFKYPNYRLVKKTKENKKFNGV